MIHATEQQLALVSRKVERLEQLVANDVSRVKTLRANRDEAVRLVETLQAQLAEARRKAEEVIRLHDEATLELKQNAAEYSKAQVLKKRYKNSLDELTGRCRGVVVLGGTPNPDVLVVADECTINVPVRNKQFVVDAVCPVEEGNMAGGSELLLSGPGWSIQSMVSDVVKGTNSTVIGYGPACAGTTSLMFGSDRSAWATTQGGHRHPVSSMTPVNGSLHRGAGAVPSNSTKVQPMPAIGVVPLFFTELFASLEALEVTHFNMRLSVGELASGNVVNDLLSDQLVSLNVLSGVGPTAVGGVGGMSSGSGSGEIRLLPFQSATEALVLLRTALQKVNPRGKSHIVVHSVIENFDVRGHFRRATATFVDLAGALAEGSNRDPSAVGAQSMHPDQMWVNRTIQGFIDGLSVAASGKSLADTPVGRTPILQLLGEALGGNTKTCLLCCISCSKNSFDAVLDCLVHLFQIKSVVNHPVPYDIPAELQRLQAEMEEFE